MAQPQPAAAGGEPAGAVLAGAHRRVALGQPRVMGVLNVTPDSFSDGGAFHDYKAAIARARAMIAEGAAIIDVGGESTRPGAEPVAADVQMRRVGPVLEHLAVEENVYLSVDTSDPTVMRRAVAAGADMINDVRGLRADGAIAAAAESSAAVCIGHMQGEPASMQQGPAYVGVVAEVGAYLAERAADCQRAGIAADRISLDPGFGFGKTREHNVAMLQAIDRFCALGYPVVLGVSRKSMFARLLDDADADARLHGSLISAFWAATRGVTIVRAHDVAATANALRLARLLGESQSENPGLRRNQTV